MKIKTNFYKCQACDYQTTLLSETEIHMNENFDPRASHPFKGHFFKNLKGEIVG